jgi:hypothetical protein
LYPSSLGLVKPHICAQPFDLWDKMSRNASVIGSRPFQSNSISSKSLALIKSLAKEYQDRDEMGAF